MKGLNNKKQNIVRTALEITCSCCGSQFIFGIDEQECYTQMAWSIPKRCPACRKEKHIQRELIAKQREGEIWQQKKEKKRKNLRHC